MKKNIHLIVFIIYLAFGCLSCKEWPGLEYKVEQKEIKVDEQLIFIDGFLQEGIPVYKGTEGNDSDPADRLVIPIRNGFGKNLTFNFIDDSEIYGICVESNKIETQNIGDRQYVYFNINGTPKNVKNGQIPISFEIIDINGMSLCGTITKTINVWPADIQRPSRDMIPTAERPFIFHHSEFNWVNQYHEDESKKVYIYDNKNIPTTQFTPPGSGVAYTTSINIHYNSIMIANNAIRPEYKEVEVNGKTEKVLTFLLPDKENLATHPEWFKLSDGTLSSEWNTDKNFFMHGVNPKPVSVSMYNENSSLVSNGNNRSRPVSSLNWYITKRDNSHPLGTYFGQSGRFKIYIKYVNNDSANDIIQYFPTHPGTGEHGWIPIEFEVKPNPVEQFVPNAELDATDWEPTENEPVKAIRGEVIRNEQPYSFKAGGGTESNTILRIWFATLKKEASITGYNIKLNQSAGYTFGFKDEEVGQVAGTGAKFGGGNANKITSETVHSFADDELNNKYFVSYVDYFVASTTTFPKAGNFKLTGNIPANSGSSNPKIPYNLDFPVTVKVEGTQTSGFVPNEELDAADWEPTEGEPVKAIRGEVVKNGIPYSFKSGKTVETGTVLRIWFATLKKEGSITGYNIKLNQSAGYTFGFNDEEVTQVAGTGAKFGGGSANKITSETVYHFADDALNNKYFISYVDYYVASGSKFPTKGTYDIKGYIPANSGDKSPKINYELDFPCRVTVTD